MAGQMRPKMVRRASILPNKPVADPQLKAELHTLQKKFDRLDKKEKRIQVSIPIQNRFYYQQLETKRYLNPQPLASAGVVQTVGGQT